MKKVALVSIIIIAILVIVALVFIFVKPGKPQPDPLFVQCSFACQSQQKTAFCDVERNLGNGVSATCDQLSSNSQYSSYNVQTCPGISCAVSEQEAAHLADQTCVSGLNGTWETPTSSGSCPQSGITAVRQINPSNTPLIAGQICCR